MCHIVRHGYLGGGCGTLLTPGCSRERECGTLLTPGVAEEEECGTLLTPGVGEMDVAHC